MIDILTDGQKIFTRIEEISRDGMTRKINMYIIRNDFIVGINNDVAEELNLKLDKESRIIMKGYGYDAGYEIVNRLSGVLNKQFTHISI